MINELDLIVFSSFLSDKKKCLKYKIDYFNPKLNYFNIIKPLLSAFLYNISTRIGLDKDIRNNEFLQIISDANMLLDLSGDSFSDDYSIIETLMNCYYIILCLLLETPIGIYSQSIGPFNHKITRIISVYCLNRVNVLIVREEITKNYLEKIGITNKIHLTADPAFLLEPIPNEKIQEILNRENINTNDHDLIGISVSQHINDLEHKKHQNNYITKMAKVVDYLVRKYDAELVFIPHVTHSEINDDRFVAKEILKLVESKDRIISINNEYSARELKGIIGSCNLFIGARMHANIAATSMNIPTLAISYSHKTQGIMRMLGLEDYVVNFDSMNFNEITYKIDKLWVNRTKINKHLSEHNKEIKKLASISSELVKRNL